MSKRPRTKPYSRELKEEILRLCHESGRSITAIATEFGVSTNSIHYWRKAADKQQQSHQTQSDSSLEAENRELKRRLAEAEQERDILKKAIGYFAQPEK